MIIAQKMLVVAAVLECSTVLHLHPQRIHVQATISFKMQIARILSALFVASAGGLTLPDAEAISLPYAAMLLPRHAWDGCDHDSSTLCTPQQEGHFGCSNDGHSIVSATHGASAPLLNVVLPFSSNAAVVSPTSG